MKIMMRDPDETNFLFALFMKIVLFYQYLLQLKTVNRDAHCTTFHSSIKQCD